MADSNRKNDRSARRTLVLLAIVIVAVIALSTYVFVAKREPPTPGGDLAPIPAAGGNPPGNGM